MRPFTDRASKRQRARRLLEAGQGDDRPLRVPGAGRSGGPGSRGHLDGRAGGVPVWRLAPNGGKQLRPSRGDDGVGEEALRSRPIGSPNKMVTPAMKPSSIVDIKLIELPPL